MKEAWQDTASQRGMAAQLMFELYALRMGWDTYRPIREDCQHDLIVWGDVGPLGPGFNRVQIKRAFFVPKGSTTLSINLKRKNGSRYDSEAVDYVVAVDVDTGRMWMFPFGDLWNYVKDRPLGRVRLTAERDRYLLETL